MKCSPFSTDQWPRTNVHQPLRAHLVRAQARDQVPRLAPARCPRPGDLDIDTEDQIDAREVGRLPDVVDLLTFPNPKPSGVDLDPLFFDGLGVGRLFGGVVEAGLYGLEQLGLVVLDGEQEVAVGFQKHLGQGPLAKQGVAGEQPEERVMVEQLVETGFSAWGSVGLPSVTGNWAKQRFTSWAKTLSMWMGSPSASCPCLLVLPSTAAVMAAAV